MQYVAPGDKRTQANATNGDLAAEFADDVARDAGVTGFARARRDHDAVRIQLADLIDRDLIVAAHVHICSKLCQVLQSHNE